MPNRLFLSLFHPVFMFSFLILPVCNAVGRIKTRLLYVESGQY